MFFPKPLFPKPGRREQGGGQFIECLHPTNHRQAVPNCLSGHPDVVCVLCGAYQGASWVGYLPAEPDIGQGGA